MTNYSKLLVAIGGLVVIVGQRYGLDLTKEVSAALDVAVAALTAFFVYQVPNKEV
jgi:hypothetical protein